ncbi:MAG: hydrogenase expression/formation protein [Rubricella sp.]
MQSFHMPPTGFGPGTQGEEADKELQYMVMPSGMRTYVPHYPEADDPLRVLPARAMLAEVARAATSVAEMGGQVSFDLTGLDRENRAFIAETLGEGEVSARVTGPEARVIQESVFAGVWTVRGDALDRLVVAHIPGSVRSLAHRGERPAAGSALPQGRGVVNAPALLHELLDKSAASARTHVVNLTLLPHTEEDLGWLDAALGLGSVTLLSRGYGNCRVTATATPRVWRVQFYNSMDSLILDTFEVTPVPEVVLAADEDLEDSGERIREVLEAVK